MTIAFCCDTMQFVVDEISKRNGAKTMETNRALVVLIVMTYIAAIKGWFEKAHGVLGIDKIHRIKDLRDRLRDVERWFGENDAERHVLNWVNGLKSVKDLVEALDALPLVLQPMIAENDAMLRAWSMDVIQRRVDEVQRQLEKERIARERRICTVCREVIPGIIHKDSGGHDVCEDCRDHMIVRGDGGREGGKPYGHEQGPNENCIVNHCCNCMARDCGARSEEYCEQ